MGLVVILSIAGLVIFLWLYFWTRQREQLGSMPGMEQVIQSVPSASGDDAVLVSREHGQVIYANDRARTWLGMNGSSPHLEHIAQMAQPTDSFLELFAGEGQASFQLGMRWVEASSHRIPSGSETRTVIVMRELGANTTNPEALDLSLAMRVINDIGEMVNASLSVEQVLQALLSIVREVVPADAGEICLWIEKDKVLEPRGWVGDALYVLALAEAGGVYTLEEGITGWIAKHRKPVLVSDPESRIAIPPKLASSPYQSFIGVPLLLGDRFVGTFELASSQPGRFSQKDLALLQAVSKQVAISIYNAQLYTDQARHIDDMASLQQVMQQDEEDYVRAVYGALTERLAKLVGADMCGVLLYNETRQALIAELPFYGVPDQVTRNYVIPIPLGSPQREIWDNQLYWISNDVADEPLVEELGLMALVNATGVYNTTLLPVSVGERRIGLLQVSNKPTEGGFTLRDIQNLRILAAQAAIVVENTRIYQREQSRETELIGLQEITHAIGSFSNEGEFYKEITARIANLMGISMCGVLLYDEPNERLVAQPPFFGVDEVLVEHYQIGLKAGSVLYEIWLEDDYWYTNTVRTDRVVIESGLEDMATAIGVTQTMLAPLTVSGRRLGVVQASNKLNGEPFNEKDARLLMIFAAQAAALIENARLVREIVNRADEAEGLRDEAQALRNIAEIAGSILQPDESFVELLAEIARLTDSPIVFVNLLDQNSTNLVTLPRYVYGVEMDEAIVQDTHTQGFERSVTMSHEPFLSNDLNSDERVLPSYKLIARKVGLRNAVVVPLAVGERSLGEIGIANRLRPAYGQHDLDTLASVAVQISATLDRITLYQSAGQNLNQRLQELDAISRVSNELTVTLDLDRILDVIRNEAARATGAEGSTVVLLKPYALWPDFSQPQMSRRLGDEKQVSAEMADIETDSVLRGADAVLINDYNLATMRPFPAQARSAVAAAFFYGDEVVGVIHLYHRKPNHFDAHAGEFLVTLASKASLGNANAMRYEEQMRLNSQLRRRVEQLNQIFELGQMLQSNTDQVTMLEAIAYSVQHSVGYDVVVMLLSDDEAGVFRRVAQAGLPLDVFERSKSSVLDMAHFDQLREEEFRVSESYFFPVDKRDQWSQRLELAALSTDFDGKRLINADNLEKWHDGDLLVVPLTNSAGNLLGLMVLDVPHDNLRPSRAIGEILEIFAHHASTTIENTRLYLSSIDSAEQEARLNEVMEAIASTLDQQAILEAVARGALRLMPFMRMTAALYDSERQGFDVLRFNVEMDSSLTMYVEAWATLDNTALGRTFEDGRDYIYYDTSPEVEYYTDLGEWHEHRERTTLIVPLITGGARLGALHLGSDLTQAFGFQEFRGLMKRMANLAAVAIQNAQLFKQAVNLKLFNESVVESIQQGIVVLDQSGRVISTNKFMEDRYGWVEKDALHKDLFVYRPELRASLLGNIREALTSGLPQERIAQRSSENGRTAVRNFYIYPLGEAGNRRGLVLMIEDVSDRAQLERDLEARASQLAVLTEVSSRITASLDFSEVVALALSDMERIIGYDTMTFWLRDGETLVLEGAKDYEDDTVPMHVTIRIDSHERLQQVVNTQNVHTISRLQGWDQLPGENNATSWMGVPLVNQGNVVGVISLSKREPSFYDTQSEQAAFAFANQVAVALANAKLFREAERRTQRLSLLNRVSVALVQSLDSEDILEIALREITQSLHVDQSRALLFERDVQVGRVVVEHPRGDLPPEGVIDLRDSALYQHIRRTVKSLVVENLAELAEDDPIRVELAPRNLHSYVLIPMAIGGQVIGAFELEMTERPRKFDAEQTDLGRIIANQAAIAIQNTSLLEQTLVRSRELETLLEAAQATSVTLDVHEVYRSVVELMMHALDMDDCALMMWDDIGREVEVQVDVNRKGDDSRIIPTGTRFNLSDYPARLRALEGREVIVINRDSAKQYPKEVQELIEAGDTAQMLVPLIIRDQAIGLIQMELSSDYRAFTHREVRLATALAAQATTAIENARLSTETTARVGELYTINDLSQTISTTMRIDDMIAVVRDRVASIMGAEEIYLALYDSDTEMISFPMALHNGESYEIAPRKLNDDEVSYIIRRRQTLTMGSDYFSTDELRRSLGIRPGEGDVKSYMGVPLISGDEVVGVLALRDTTRKRAFGLNTSGILSTIANQLGAAIQNARLFNKLSVLNRNLEEVITERSGELLQERDRIDTLYRITSELGRTLDLERVLIRALEMVAGAVGADDGVIMQIDPTTDKLHSRATLVKRANPDEDHPAAELASWLVENQDERIVVFNNLAETPQWNADRPGAAEWRSALAVLLEINDDIHGVMILLGKEADLFTQPHVKLVVAAANQVAAAINNSDLYYLIRDQAERLGMLVLSEQEEAEKSNAILEGIADGVILINARGQIIRFNSAAERILEIPRDEVLAQPLAQLSGLSEALVNKWTRQMDGWSHTPESYRPNEFLSERVDIDEKVVNARLSPVHIENQFLGMVLVFRDITKEVEVDRMKGEFISNVSHELRTPLTPIKGYTDLMLLGAAGQITSQQEYFLKTIKSHTQRLETLVNDLLNISKLDDNKERLKFELVDMGELLESVVSGLKTRPEHDDKQITVTINVPPDLPRVEADPSRMGQVFVNLVDNAFNYTYAGGSIDIDARLQEDGEHVLIAVKDTGIGIPEEMKDRIWERFVRNEEHALVMDVAGTGLGLPIAKTLVDLHRGDIWFESEHGQGTTFLVSLPIRQD